jgi:uncharacterized membrane protein YgdD (TMEM256/DUF423 family)
MQDRHLIALGAINMFIAIACGAFGAHALKKILNAEMLAIWHTAVQYQVMHGLALIAVGILMQQKEANHTKALIQIGIAFLVGILIFSGSLYALSLSGIKMLGAITPLGGLAFLFGWGRLAQTYYSKTAEK